MADANDVAIELPAADAVDSDDEVDESIEVIEEGTEADDDETGRNDGGVITFNMVTSKVNEKCLRFADGAHQGQQRARLRHARRGGRERRGAAVLREDRAGVQHAARGGGGR